VKPLKLELFYGKPRFEDIIEMAQATFEI